MASLSSADEIIEEAKRGRMFILVDDEDRENEGDLVIPAEMASPAVVNFMAMHARGLICLALTRQRVEELSLPLMSARNQTRHATAFTVSIEAREGVTTGISAADRARTIAVAIDADRSHADIVSPGHVFPLVAQDGGVLVRAGHTEAAVDVARLAGCYPAGVICEIMNEDGTMARLPDLLRFARRHDLKVGTISDLIAYRRRREKTVRCRARTRIESRFGGAFDLHLYASTVETGEHLALVKGDLSGDAPVLVRMHQFNLLADALGDMTCGRFFGGDARSRGTELECSLRLIAEAGRGVCVLLQDTAGDSLARLVEERSHPRHETRSPRLRQHGLGTQILLDLGVRNIELLTNSKRKIVGIDGYGIDVIARRAIGGGRQPDEYLGRMTERNEGVPSEC